MTRYSLGEARNDLNVLVDQAEQAPVELTRDGEPVAVLFGERLARFRRDHADVLDDEVFPVDVRDRS